LETLTVEKTAVVNPLIVEVFVLDHLQGLDNIPNRPSVICPCRYLLQLLHCPAS